MNPYLEIILRTLAVYIFIVVAIRLFGKKEIAQLTVIDLVFILLISNSVQNAMVGNSSSLEGGLIAAGSLFLTNYLLKFFLYRNLRLNKLVQGNPVILIHEGKLIEDHLKKERISLNELEAAVREHGVASVDKVNLAVLETDGNISILSDNYRHKTVKKRKVHKVLAKST